MSRSVVVLTSLLLAIVPMVECAFADPMRGLSFDRSLLAGVWAESVNTSPACAESNLHHTFELTTDGKTLNFKLDRKWTIATGQAVERYSATVVSSTKHSLVIRYNTDIGTPPSGYPIEWEISFVAPGVYRWRAEAWPEGNVNTVVGVKCSP